MFKESFFTKQFNENISSNNVLLCFSSKRKKICFWTNNEVYFQKKKIVEFYHLNKSK